MSLGTLIDGHRIVVCIGSGGVGKTTLSAAIALDAALRGRRAVVLTIDPARALGRALGVSRIEAGPQTIAEKVLGDAELFPQGSLAAAMLDQKRAWDAFIERRVPSELARRSILENRFYQELSRRFAGATEYVAVEELSRLHESGSYDLIVLDTPPAAHALDFVRAPDRLDRMLDPELARWLIHPERSAGAARSALRYILRRLAGATGRRTFGEIREFFESLEGLLDEIQRRSVGARALLYGQGTAFVLVVGPEERVLAASHGLAELLQKLGVPLKAVVQNRIHPLPGGLESCGEDDVRALCAELRAAGCSEACTDWISNGFFESLAVAQAENRRWADFTATLGSEVARARIAELDEDVHSLRGLARLSAELRND